MTPEVREILVDTRKRIHAATCSHANIGDTNALLCMDQLLTTEALRAGTPMMSAADLTIPIGGDHDAQNSGLTAHHIGPSQADTRRGEVQGMNELQAELTREKKLREADSLLIDGLRAELNALKGKP